MKKVFLFIAALCCTVMMNAEDFIVDGIRYNVTGTDPNTVEVVSNGYSGDIVIPATVTNGDTEYSVTRIGDGAFATYPLNSVSLPEGLQIIGRNAFKNCGIKGDLTIPNTVTKIGGSSFSGCSNLTSVSLPEKLKTIEMYTFEYCTSLSSVSLPEELEIISVQAFYSCKNLASVTIPSTVTSIDQGAFAETTNLNKVLVYSDNLTNVCEAWSKTIPTFVTGKSYDNYKSGVFKDYNVKVFPDADNVADLMKSLFNYSDEKINAIKSFIKVLGTLGEKQNGPAIIVTDKDDKEIILYAPKKVEYIKVKE